MTKRLLPLLLMILLSSCSTIFTKEIYKMEVRSDTYKQVKVYDSTFNLPAAIEVKRSKEALPMVFISDTISKNYLLKASLSPKFLYGNLAVIPFGVGYLVDLTTQKRFYYGKSISVNASDTLTENNTLARHYEISNKNVSNYFTRDFDTRKGQLNVIASIPWVNSFHFKPIGKSAQNNTGFLGIGTGVEYFYREKNFVGFYASAAIDFMVPFPAPVTYDGEQEFFYSLAAGLTNNHKLNRFTVGYGLNYSRNTWRLSNNEYDPSMEGSRMPEYKSNNSLGLMANGYYQLGKNFFMGLNYKPSLLALDNTPKLNYEHVISLDLVWKIKLKD